MKKRLLALLLSAACLTMALPGTVSMADGRRVVTLGADLSEEQKQAILRYFGIQGQNIQTLTITNADERAQLGSFVPLEQIGTYTFSCAYVNPTNSGGIQVKTANLTWVTSNMIASTLSTSGVVNCEVLAASPFEVSGTGALTGIIMAYESAVGEQLDETKKELATQELITTTTIADSIGQQEATQIVNASKMQVIQGNTVKEGDTNTVNEGDTIIVNEGDTNTVNEGDTISQDDIDVIINQVAEEEEVTLTDEDRQLLKDLLEEIARQDYDYDEMKETLERVESNMEQLTGEKQTESAPESGDQTEAAQEETNQTEASETETPETLPEDSILTGTDDSALGEGVVIDATDEEAMPETQAPQTETAKEALPQTENPGGFDITTSDTYTSETGTKETEAPATEAPASETAAIETETPVSETAAIETEAPVSETVAIETEAPALETAAAETETDASEAVTIQTETSQTETAQSETAQSEESLALPLENLVVEPITGEENGNQPALAGTDRLTLYLNTSNAATGAGTLTVTDDADGSVYETVTLNDSQRAVAEAMDQEKLAELGWTEGTKITVFLTDPLEASSSYSISLQEGALTSGDGSQPYAASSAPWNLQTAAYGVTLVETADAFPAGSAVNASVLLDGTAAVSAAAANYDAAALTFSTAEFSASGDFTITPNQPGEFTFDMIFLDAAGTEVRTETYTIRAQ